MTREQPGRSRTNGTPDASESPQAREAPLDPQAPEDPGSSRPPGAGAHDDADRPGAIGSSEDGAGGAEDPPVGGKQEAFSLLKAFGGWGAVLDAGLPGVAFVVAYTAFGQNLRLALLVALALGGLFAVIRLWRKDPMQNVLGGFFAVAIAAAIANATGRAQDFYLSGLIINAVYLVGWSVANLLRFPLMGVVIGLAAGWGLEWRKDPKLMRAFTLAGWVWVAFFAVRLAVQVPMYLNDALVQIGVARLVMGWPLWLVVLVTSYFVIKATVPMENWKAVRRAAAQWAEGQRPGLGKLAGREQEQAAQDAQGSREGERSAGGEERAAGEARTGDAKPD